MAESEQLPPRQSPDGPAARAGMTLEQYDWHVRDMAKSVVHVPALYVAALVAGLTRLLPHPVFQEPGGWWRETMFFACGFLGAWAVLRSVLLRDAGLRSWTATFTVPLAVLVATLIWIALPEAADLGDAGALWSAVLLAGPGPIAWVVTDRRWKIERARVAHLLVPADADDGADGEASS